MTLVDISRSAAALTAAILVLAVLAQVLRPQLRFIWHCFIRPLSATDQKDRLVKFYEGQADIYDKTRNGLLRGRNTMLSLSASHIRSLRASNPKKRLVWVDIGGGTGHNIELMDKHIPIKSFDAVYLIDLCEPLLQVARKRFAAKGWTNVFVLCQDASQFVLPEWSDGKDPKGSVGFITLSYSLSMVSMCTVYKRSGSERTMHQIPSYYPLLDRIDYVLSPEDGLFGVVDFYTAGKQPSLHEKAIGGTSKECGWLSRWFWQIWFLLDRLADRTSNTSLGHPYYIWLGRPRSCDVSKVCHAFEVEGGNLLGNCSPLLLQDAKPADFVPPLEIGEPVLAMKEQTVSASVVVDITPPLSSFHYHVNKEDPFEDMKHLNLSKDDSMFVITSGGDNALHYAIEKQPKRAHLLNSYSQGHLAELKLAALQSLSYDEFFSLFGTGRHPHFRRLLDSKLAPHLSSSAYQFWRLNDDAFKTAFYMRGYSGWALRVAHFIFSVAGVTKYVHQLCECDTLDAQVKIWQTKLRPVLLNPIVVALLKSPVFCWNALGVPLNQRQMLLEEGTIYDFICHTLDPLISTYLLKTGNYFYLLALLGHYTPACCPNYLTLRGFNALKSNKGGCLDAFRLHTDSIVNVLRGLSKGSLTRALIMDHLDWFTPGSRDVVEEVAEFHRVLSPGGMIFWRSAARHPWYNEVFTNAGFDVEPVAIRDGSRAIDRVNMYASFWRAIKRS
ncbi:hypothetical protein H0H93_008631 [Arthromyces matolae]|nr:hypothetical protein H0H93_008631 [Arthromyces matolae]